MSWLFLAIWILFGLIAYGGQFAWCENNGHRQLLGDCVAVRFWMLAIGPIGFITVAIETKGFKHGLRFR